MNYVFDYSPTNLMSCHLITCLAPWSWHVLQEIFVFHASNERKLPVTGTASFIKLVCKNWLHIFKHTDSSSIICRCSVGCHSHVLFFSLKKYTSCMCRPIWALFIIYHSSLLSISVSSIPLENLSVKQHNRKDFTLLLLNTVTWLIWACSINSGDTPITDTYKED